ncbi:MAG: hypothetical protein KDC24_09800, partial [Saprospiraceae bacterium]|nr:hypothetical protein [Saprospiraceae bacterium]
GPKRWITYILHGCQQKGKITQFNISDFYHDFKFGAKLSVLMIQDPKAFENSIKTDYLATFSHLLYF